MPRLRQVSRDEVISPRVLEVYEKHFGSRDPVSEPGTASGTPGTWWTVFALDEELVGLILDRHSWQFSDKRELDPVLRELAMARTGWLSESIFVFSQHCKALRRLGVDQPRIDGVASGATYGCYSTVEQLVLAYTDDLVVNGGRVAEERFARLREALSDVAILELSFMVTTYMQSSVLCRALRLEFDDRSDPVVEQSAT